jgi:TonB family protein
MNRLQKKCFIVSVGTHLLLGIILLVGPAFLSSKSKSNDMPPLDAIPSKLIDAAFQGGGNSQLKPPPVLPDPPTPPAPVPPPPPTHTEAVHHDPDPVVPQTPDLTHEAPTKHKIDLALTPVTHHTNRVTKPKDSSEADAQAREADKRRHDLATAINRTARELSTDVSSPTTIDIQPGTGGGEAYANYGQAVISIYKQNWVPPEDASNDNPVTKASVTIRSDGTVVEAHITHSSGDASVDSSVQRTLDRVTYIAPFPEGAKDKQRNYIIKFDLKARRLQG